MILTISIFSDSTTELLMGFITFTIQVTYYDIQTNNQNGCHVWQKQDLATSEIIDLSFYICLRYSTHWNVPLKTIVLNIINYLMSQWHLATGQYIVHSFIVIRVTTVLHINSLSYLWINQHLYLCATFYYYIHHGRRRIIGNNTKGWSPQFCDPVHGDCWP